MRFKPGQQVVCVRPNGPRTIFNGPGKGLTFNFGPVFNELVTILDYDKCMPGQVRIVEYQRSPTGNRVDFSEINFEPLVSDSVLRLELESVPEPFCLSFREEYFKKTGIHVVIIRKTFTI